MITNPAIEPPAPSPILDKTDQPYSHSDPFVTTPNDYQMHQQPSDQHPTQPNEMDPPSPRPDGQGFPLTPNEDSIPDTSNYQGGYYNDSYNNYPQHGYTNTGYPQQGSQPWPQQPQQPQQGTNMDYYPQHHHQGGGGGYPNNYYNPHQQPSNYHASDPYYQQQQMQHSQYYQQHPHGHHHVHSHPPSNGGSVGGGGSNNCTPSPHAASDDSSGDTVNEPKPSPHHFQQQYPHGKPGYPGGPFEMYAHPSHPSMSDANCPPVQGGMLPHNTNTGYVKPELGTQPISTSVLKRPRSSLLPAPKRSKKSSRHRDPNEPQKPVSAYALFFRDTQAQIKSRSPAATFGEVSKMVAALWDQLDPDNKANYKRRTETAKKEYLKRLAAYRASLISKGDFGNIVSPYNVGGGSSGFAYPTPRSAGVSHLAGNIANPTIGEQDSLDQPSKLPGHVNHDRGMAGQKEGPDAPVPLNGGPGQQYSPVNPQQTFPSPNSQPSPSQHHNTLLKPVMGPGPHQTPSSAYGGAHHHIGSQISTGSTMATKPQSSQHLAMGGTSFHSSELHQTPQSNPLGAGHLARGNYQQPGRVS